MAEPAPSQRRPTTTSSESNSTVSHEHARTTSTSIYVNMPHAVMPSSGLQAIVLCGPGSSLSTFTSSPADFPKAVIPIANRPMIWYPLDACYHMGISDITIITPPESRAALESALATNPALTSLPLPRPELLAPQDLTQTTGTGELFRLPEVQKCITSDFIVLPCDIVSELDGSKLIQQWMTLNPLSLTTGRNKSFKGALTVFYPTHGLDNISTKKDETDFLATIPIPQKGVSFVSAPNASLRPHIEEVVLNMPTDTLNDKIEEDKGFLRLRQSLLAKHGRVKMRMKYRDAHFYIFPMWVRDFVKANDGIESLSEDVLGCWGKAGWQDGLTEKLGLVDVLLGGSGNRKSGGDAGIAENTEVHEIDPAALSSTQVSRTTAASQPQPSFASRVGAKIQPDSPRTSIELPPLLAYVQSPQQPRSLIRRVDTSVQLINVSLHLAKIPSEHPLAHEHKIQPSAKVGEQARISQEDCLIGENVQVGSRSNLKECVVGANCEIGRNVRMTKCLLMDGCVVGDGVQLMGCIVGRRAKIEGVPLIGANGPPSQAAADSPAKSKGKKPLRNTDEDGDKTRLTDCEIAPGFVVEAGTEAKGEKFMGFDTDDIEDDESMADLEDADVNDELDS